MTAKFRPTQLYAWCFAKKAAAVWVAGGRRVLAAARVGSLIERVPADLSP